MKVPPHGVAKSAFDSHPWTPTQDREINRAVKAALDTPAGAQLLHYLREITINTVLDPSASDAHLRHHEGARWLYTVLMLRLATARSTKQGDPNGPS